MLLQSFQKISSATGKVPLPVLSIVIRKEETVFSGSVSLIQCELKNCIDV